jgi:hypothetical protein
VGHEEHQYRLQNLGLLVACKEVAVPSFVSSMREVTVPSYQNMGWHSPGLCVAHAMYGFISLHSINLTKFDDELQRHAPLKGLIWFEKRGSTEMDKIGYLLRIILLYRAYTDVHRIHISNVGSITAVEDTLHNCTTAAKKYNKHTIASLMSYLYSCDATFRCCLDTLFFNSSYNFHYFA